MKNRIRSGMTFMLAALCLAVLWPGPALSQNANPGIIPAIESYGGYTYQEWHAICIDQKIVPLYGYPPSSPDFNSPDVYLLPVKKSAALQLYSAVPAGKAIMLTVMGILDSDDPALDRSGNEISGIDQDFEDWKGFAEKGLFSCTIDGVPVRSLQDYIFKSKLPQNVILSGDGPKYGPLKTTYNWSIGIDLLLYPLTPGNHTIRIYNRIPEHGNFTYDLTYKIEVKPYPSIKNK
jgi:hypothetical protein